MNLHKQWPGECRFEHARAGETHGGECGELAGEPPTAAQQRDEHGDGTERDAHADHDHGIGESQIMFEQPLRRVIREIVDDEVFVALAFERVHAEPVRAECEQCEHEREHPAQDAARGARANHQRIDLREPGFDLGLQILRRILGRALAFAFGQRHEATRAGGINLCGDARVLIRFVCAYVHALLQHAPLCVVCGGRLCVGIRLVVLAHAIHDTCRTEQ